MSEVKRLYRSESDRMLAGVCGGLAEYLGVDPSLVRIGFVVLTLLGGSGILVYLLMWLIVPNQSAVGTTPRDAAREGATEIRDSAEKVAREAKDAYERWRGGVEQRRRRPRGSGGEQASQQPRADGEGNAGDTEPPPRGP